MSSVGSEIGYGGPYRGRHAHSNSQQQRLFVLADVPFSGVSDMRKIHSNVTKATPLSQSQTIVNTIIIRAAFDLAKPVSD